MMIGLPASRAAEIIGGIISRLWALNAPTVAPIRSASASTSVRVTYMGVSRFSVVLAHDALGGGQQLVELRHPLVDRVRVAGRGGLRALGVVEVHQAVVGLAVAGPLRERRLIRRDRSE